MGSIKFDNKFHEIVYKLNRMFGKIEELLAMITLWGTIIVSVIFISARFIFHVPTAWADESSRYLLILLGWLGAAYAASKNDHLCIDLVESIFKKHTKDPEKWLNVVDRIAQALSLIFLCGFAYFYTDFVIKMQKVGTPSATLPVPMWVPMALVLVGVVLIIMHSLCHVILPKEYWNIEDEKKVENKTEGKEAK